MPQCGAGSKFRNEESWLYAILRVSYVIDGLKRIWTDEVIKKVHSAVDAVQIILIEYGIRCHMGIQVRQ